MRRVTYLILLLLLFEYSIGQKKLPMNYFGASRSQVKQQLGDYLSILQYQGQITEADSTVTIKVTKQGKDWTIYSAFYFDAQGKCNVICVTRCDMYRNIAFERELNSTTFGWVRIGENTYLSKYRKLELMEVFRTSFCLITKRTPLKLSRKEFRKLRRHQYKGSNWCKSYVLASLVKYGRARIFQGIGMNWKGISHQFFLNNLSRYKMICL